MSTVSQLDFGGADQHINGSAVEGVRVGNFQLAVSKVFDTYWRFAAERQAIFFRRLRNQFPVTPDQRPLPLPIYEKTEI
jgi:hypothetical protein